jgi:hypothetical protein
MPKNKERNKKEARHSAHFATLYLHKSVRVTAFCFLRSVYSKGNIKWQENAVYKVVEIGMYIKHKVDSHYFTNISSVRA